MKRFKKAVSLLLASVIIFMIAIEMKYIKDFLRQLKK